MKKLFYFFALVLILASCRTSQKITDSHKVSNEVTVEADKDSTGKKTEEVVNVKSEDNTVEYQFVFDVTDSTERNTVSADDYIPFVQIDSNGTITVKGPIKNFTSKTHNKTTDSLKVNKTDTSSVKTKAKVTTKATEETVHKQTTRKGIFAVAFWPVFIAAIIFFIFLYLKRKAKKKAADGVLK